MAVVKEIPIDGASTSAPRESHEKTATSPFGIAPSESNRFSTHSVSPIRHNFDQHPLMQLPRLAQLAHDLMPSRQCRFIRPGTTQASEFFHTPKTPDGAGIDEMFARIEEPGSWIALYNVQTDPAYAGFLDEVMTSAKSLLQAEQPGVFRVAGFIFISAPPSVTPFHIDRENNFWLQIRGRKIMTVFDHRDRAVVKASDAEDFIVSGSLKNVRLDPAHRALGRDFDVGPGDGVYFPATSPHMTRTPTGWVQPGNGVSISIGVVFYTDVTRHHARVHQCNRVLRKFGLTPTFPGESAWRDAIKAPLGRAIAASRARWRNYVAPPGAY